MKKSTNLTSRSNFGTITELYEKIRDFRMVYLGGKYVENFFLSPTKETGFYTPAHEVCGVYRN